VRAVSRWIPLGAALVLVGLLFGCAAAGTAHGSPASIQPLPTGVKVDYQLGGSYAPPAGVRIVTRDSTSRPAAGLYNICYVNGFQTQSENKILWLSRHPTLVLRYPTGKPIFDPGWPDEMILDASTPGKREGIARVLGTTIDRCSAKGFQAIEFDNLDSYSRSHHELSLGDDIALAKLLVRRAHADHLAAGQKNTSELGNRGRDDIHFDFAVAEECYRYNECTSYTRVYGPRVIDIEYTDDLRGTFASDCAAPQTPPMTILRDVDLTTPANHHYVYESC
jgi:Glycoside-hydrolase family GH114